MMPSPASQPTVNINHIQDSMMNLVYNVCSIVTMPVEMALRPRYGSRYFPPVITFLTAVMMIVVPAFVSLAGSLAHMAPFVRFQGDFGMIGMDGFSRLFFLGGFAHGFRIWRRMLHMEREQNSVYEGPALPFFAWLPGASFWRIRIIYEPVFVFVLSLVLPNFFILEPGAAHFLTICALFLAMKQYVAWYRQWEFLRELMDMRFAGPIIAKLAENEASDDDLASVHLASFPKDLSPDIRQAAVSYLARVFSPDGQNAGSSHTPKEGESHDRQTT
jgi:hypothetical protein